MRRTDGRAFAGPLQRSKAQSDARQHAGVEVSGDTIIHYVVFTLRKDEKSDEEKHTHCLGRPGLERSQRAQ